MDLKSDAKFVPLFAFGGVFYSLSLDDLKKSFEIANGFYEFFEHQGIRVVRPKVNIIPWLNDDTREECQQEIFKSIDDATDVFFLRTSHTHFRNLEYQLASSKGKKIWNMSQLPTILREYSCFDLKDKYLEK